MRIGFVLVILLGLGAHAFAARDVTLKAADGLEVFGTFYPAQKERPVILLFHQASSNRAEYAEIAPRLVKLGFNALAIDQRNGGSMFGAENETATKADYGYSYLETLPDLEATLAWAEVEGYADILIWGSSYSAALVFLLAAEHPEVAGVLAFSPDEYLGEDSLVKDAAAKIMAPVFVTSASHEAGAAETILNAAQSDVKTQFIPEGYGEHGASALLGDDKGEYWRAVESFLGRW